MAVDDFNRLPAERLDALRDQLKALVGGEAIPCDQEALKGAVGAKCGSHSSHVDNDGWI